MEIKKTINGYSIEVYAEEYDTLMKALDDGATLCNEHENFDDEQKYQELRLELENAKKQYLPNRMRFIQTHSMGSDCTAPYDVEDFPDTVGELIDEILKRKEWGYIYIESKFLTIGDHLSRERFKYEKELISPVPSEEWRKKKVIEVKAAGGWGSMDYHIKTT